MSHSWQSCQFTTVCPRVEMRTNPPRLCGVRPYAHTADVTPGSRLELIQWQTRATAPLAWVLKKLGAKVTIPAANRKWNPSVLNTNVVEKVKNGDITAFEELYTLYKTPVYALCLRFTGDGLDAEDLTQEVFLRVYRKASSFRGDSAFGSWLYRVATNVAKMHLRKRHLDEIPFDVFETKNRSIVLAAPARSHDHCDPVKRIALLRALCDLTQSKRTLVLLHDIKGLTHNEVAQHLGVTLSTSKSRLYQAHRKLRDTLGGTKMRTDRRIAP